MNLMQEPMDAVITIHFHNYESIFGRGMFIHKMNYMVAHMPTGHSSMMLEVVRNQRAIMNFLLTHITGEKV